MRGKFYIYTGDPNALVGQRVFFRKKERYMFGTPSGPDASGRVKSVDIMGQYNILCSQNGKIIKRRTVFLERQSTEREWRLYEGPARALLRKEVAIKIGSKFVPALVIDYNYDSDTYTVIERNGRQHPRMRNVYVR